MCGVWCVVCGYAFIKFMIIMFVIVTRELKESSLSNQVSIDCDIDNMVSIK